MMFKDLDKCFTRAFIYSFAKKKLFFTYPFIFLIGIIFIFFRTLFQTASKWASLSMIFLPILISFAILFILGIFLTRIYYHEVKNLKCTYLDILKRSVDKVSQTFYISIVSLAAFVILWIVFGLIVAVKEIPHVGSFVGVFLSIVAYVIILFFIALCIFNVLALFFVTPMLLKTKLRIKAFSKIFIDLKNRVFINFVHFLIAIATVLFIAIILLIATYLTKVYFAIRLDSIYIGLESFFIMIPFTILITPFVVFYFNFALEAYNLMHQRESQ